MILYSQEVVTNSITFKKIKDAVFFSSLLRAVIVMKVTVALTAHEAIEFGQSGFEL